MMEFYFKLKAIEVLIGYGVLGVFGLSVLVVYVMVMWETRKSKKRK